MASGVIKKGTEFLRRSITFDKVEVPANGVHQYPNTDASLSGYEFLGIVGSYVGTNSGLATFVCQTSNATNSVIQFGLLNARNFAITPSNNPTLQALYRKL